MAGRITKAEQQLEPDPKYGDKVLSRFINSLMIGGNKATTTRIVYKAFDEIERRIAKEPLEGDVTTGIEVFHQALDRVRPSVEVRSKRVGGANYQVPIQINRRRQQSMTFRWIITAAREDKGKPMHLRLAKELLDAARGEGKAVQTRTNTHRMAEANKAFAHFAW